VTLSRPRATGGRSAYRHTHPLSGRHDETGMQVTAVRPRVTAAERARRDLVGRDTHTTNAGAPLAPQRHATLHRGRGQPGQHRRLACPRVGLTGAVVILANAAAVEETYDPWFHGGQDLGHVQSGETRHGVKHQGSCAVLGEDAVQYECVDVDIQIERSAETLDDGHGAPATVNPLIQERATAQPAQHRTHVDGDDRATQVVIPRQPVAQAVRQARAFFDSVETEKRGKALFEKAWPQRER
jgi:hypothetical protein